MVDIDINARNGKSVAAQALKECDFKVVLCIGTEKVAADSIGPKVGSLINENMSSPLFVYGLEGSNVTAENLEKAAQMISKLHPSEKVLVVDAAVGDSNQVGRVQIGKYGIFPGKATNKNLTKVGDYSIIGIIAHKNMQDFYSANSERFLMVNQMSQFIASAILLSRK